MGITENAICPVYTVTKMALTTRDKICELIDGQIPSDRLGRPYELACCLVFMAFDEASFINGLTISENGGQFLV